MRLYCGSVHFLVVGMEKGVGGAGLGLICVGFPCWSLCFGLVLTGRVYPGAGRRSRIEYEELSGRGRQKGMK